MPFTPSLSSLAAPAPFCRLKWALKTRTAGRSAADWPMSEHREGWGRRQGDGTRESLGKQRNGLKGCAGIAEPRGKLGSGFQKLDHPLKSSCCQSVKADGPM